MPDPVLETFHLAEDVPVIAETDLCVLGGSCTGVFAAVRAARLGSRVAIVEKQNHFGGVAPITCTWHSLRDSEHRQTIIAGLTLETLERLDKRHAVKFIHDNLSKGSEFRPGDLKLVLDDLIVEHHIQPHLHTLLTGPVVREGRLVGVVVQNKSGRGIIRAKTFIDATGDGDLCARLGLPEYRYPQMLPPTTCAFLANWPESGVDIGKAVKDHGDEFGLPQGFVWGGILPGTNVFMLAGTRVPHVDCSVAVDLTRAEIEGRRQVRAILDLLSKYRPGSPVVLCDFPMSIGIRDTRHIRCRHQLTGDEILHGTRFPDAIANGSYRVDTHHQDKPGITFLYLDGRRQYARPGHPAECDRWRPETASNPTFYQVPLRSLVVPTFGNLMLAGRMLDADIIAFSGVRVMVNMNQTGEAAGVTAHLAMQGGRNIPDVDPQTVRATLAKGGSVIL